ncbi:hypothetical protein A1Q2_00961 [Trichosporon asahii var. asahii CBS 8904]|uniref:Ribitol kinase n=1 Tax=Trichosporon asahii var. asahii (strain CBS 8904) TaxID=1220162 RepID=K1VVY8_TRIAC|nr:hypothetical protein A1Q2_00961 [Trichosporon asahii var. asahii CBS 8904]
MEYFIGFDVGTGSARACLVDREGTLLSEHSEATKTQRSSSDHRIFEQSTSDIWDALSACSKAVLKDSGVDPTSVKGVGFDATCSLAVVDDDGTPMSVSRISNGKEDDSNLGKTGKSEFDVILWADHRAEEEADTINATAEAVLSFVGGTMSLEMETPKTLWLKKHMDSGLFEKANFFDLPDYLTFRATGSKARSNCSLACKFSYVPPGTEMTHGGTTEISHDGWSARFFGKIGLDSIVERDFIQVGGIPGKNGLVLSAGQPVGQGLDKQAAADLGLKEGTAVGSAVIDAYSGWIGTVAARATNAKGEEEPQPTMDDASHRLAACAGTSTCHIVQSEDGISVPGVWGPYRNAVFPGNWMNEGGQSSTGQLIDFVITTHPAYPKLKEEAKKQGVSQYEVLGHRLEEMQERAGAPTLTHLTKDLHFYPDLHGNRSPLADPKMKGMITGLELDDSLDDLAEKFNVTLEAIALQTRHIVDTMNECGHKIDAVYMSGSQAKNGPLMRLLATVLQMPVVIPPNPAAAVPLGSAMLGRFAHEAAQAEGHGIKTQEEADQVAQQHGARLWDIMVEMTKPAKRIEPRDGELGRREKKLLDAKYEVFRDSIETQRRWRALIEKAAKE